MATDQVVERRKREVKCPVCGALMEDGFLQFVSPYDMVTAAAQWIKITPGPREGFTESLPENMGVVDWYSRTMELGGFRCPNCRLVMLRY